MKNENRFYTPKELVDILTALKSIGVLEVKFQGCEAKFDIETGRKADAEVAVEQAPARPAEPEHDEVRCEKHGKRMVEGNYGPYCFECHKEKKMKKGEWRGR